MSWIAVVRESDVRLNVRLFKVLTANTGAALIDNSFSASQIDLDVARLSSVTMNTTEALNPTRPSSFIEDGTYLIVNASPERRNHVILADDGSLAAGSKQQDGEPALNVRS